MHMRLIVLTLALGVTLAHERADAGGVPDKLPAEWVTVKAGPDADIVEFIRTLPHDPNPLGVRAAHLRQKEYSQAFASTRFFALDGTPLAGRWAINYDGKPRPGVVLVGGTPQTKDDKFMVELAELFWRNGWHVLAIDLRMMGDSRRFSNAMSTDGLKEPDDILGAVRTLRGLSKATSVSVIGFSSGGVSLVKAMARDDAPAIAAGIAVTAPIGARPPFTPPPPDYRPTPLAQWFLDFYRATSMYEYYERAARSYGVGLDKLTAEMSADREITRVKASLLMLHTLDDVLMHAHVRAGRSDGGPYSLAYRETVKDHPHVRTVVLDRGNHAGMVYLSDPHWFGLAALGYLKHWQARDADHVTVAVPPLDVLAEGTVSDQTVTYRLVVRNHGVAAVGALDAHLDLPDGARLAHCYLGAEGLARCAKDGSRLTWTLPRLSGGKTTAGPFVAVVDIASLKPGKFAATAWVEQDGILRQEVTLEKK
jgi:alpha-beta hydrolase superfamily lysophospholipase